jgi:thiamine biosynthesis lipoprotein
MGSDCHLLVVGPAAVLDAVVALLEQLEASWSRFRADSDIAAVSAAGGRPVPVRAETVLLVERMLEARRLTDGWYDPTMQTELRALGYDRDRSLLPAAAGAPVLVATGDRAPAPIGLEGRTVTVPSGSGLDAGSIGKGLAADLLVELATDHGATGVLVNLGGDVRARGHDDDGAPWGVVVADDAHDGAPTDGRWEHDSGVLIGLTDGAVATSTVVRRRWATADGTAHHLLDPRSGGPTTHDLRTVTVVAGRGWWADATATAVLAAGPAGPGLAIELGLTCRLTWADGTRLGLGDWDAVVS